MADEIPITFLSDGQQVIGIWHAPKPGIAQEEGAPAVILCHGFGGNRTESQRVFVYMARALAAVGMACLRFDFRGSGDSAGEFSSVTVAHEVADLLAAVAFVESQPGVDVSRIGVMGLSLGGLVAVLGVEQLQQIRAMALWNPVADTEAAVGRRRTDASDVELAAAGVVDCRGWPISAAFLKELLALRPLEAVTHFAKPLLIVLGEDDESVPMQEGLSYAEARRARQLPVDVHTIPGAGHTFATLATRDEAIAATRGFFERELK